MTTVLKGVIGELLTPDALLPQQFYRAGPAVIRERKLMLAVLENAFDDFQRYVYAQDPQGRRLFKEAERWIASNDDRYLFSFCSICETLDIDPGYLRKGLGGWKERALNESLFAPTPDEPLDDAADPDG